MDVACQLESYVTFFSLQSLVASHQFTNQEPKVSLLSRKVHSANSFFTDICAQLTSHLSLSFTDSPTCTAESLQCFLKLTLATESHCPFVGRLTSTIGEQGSRSVIDSARVSQLERVNLPLVPFFTFYVGKSF